MVPIVSLLMPIIVSAAVVWIATAVVWMAFPHHKKDFKGFPNEDALIDALRPQDLDPGMYDVPHLTEREEMRNPDVQRKFEDGPAGFFTIVPHGMPAMGKQMVISFAYQLVICFVLAYVAGRTLQPGASFLSVFRIVATVGWLAYAAATIPDSIWFGRPWKYTTKLVIDGFVYGVLAGCIFGWFWPGV